MKRGVPVAVKCAAGIPVDAPTLDRTGSKAARLKVAESDTETDADLDLEQTVKDVPPIEE